MQLRVEDGSIVSETVLPDALSNLNNVNIYISEVDYFRIFLWYRDELYCYDETFTPSVYATEFLFDSLYDCGNDIYLLGNKSDSLYRFDLKNNSILPCTIIDNGSVYDFCYTSDGYLYFMDSIGIYCWQDSTLKSILSWQSLAYPDYKNLTFKHIWIIDETTIFIQPQSDFGTWEAGAIYRIRIRATDNTDKRKTIVLESLMSNMNSWLDAAITEFNQTNEFYQVQIRYTETRNLDYDAYLKSLFLSDESPDILIAPLIYTQPYMDKDFFLDISSNI